MPTPSQNPFYGEIKCQHHPCQNRAYYKVDQQFLCGVHSRRQKRTTLLKDPQALEKKMQILKERELLVQQAQQTNFAQGKKGQVICTKLLMMKEPLHVDGFKKVFPNFKHEKRIDGFGCKALSPKAMGPVNHQEKGLPIAQNIENWHQFAKVFPWEVDEKQNPLPEFYALLKAKYSDPIPYRHKFDLAFLQAQGLKNVNIPLYSLRTMPDGIEIRYTYIESRYFYCRQYELLAPQTKEFQKLQAWREVGMNLQIIGYDGYAITQSLWEHYLDAKKPFGHELVLYTLLTVDNSQDYPWNMYRQMYPDKYIKIPF